METFSALLAISRAVINWFARGFHRSPVNYPHKGQWSEALMFSLICAGINGWVNNYEAGELRGHHAHYNVTVMNCNDVVTVYWPQRGHQSDWPIIIAPGVDICQNKILASIKTKKDFADTSFFKTDIHRS